MAERETDELAALDARRAERGIGQAHETLDERRGLIDVVGAQHDLAEHAERRWIERAHELDRHAHAGQPRNQLAPQDHVRHDRHARIRIAAHRFVEARRRHQVLAGQPMRDAKVDVGEDPGGQGGIRWKVLGDLFHGASLAKTLARNAQTSASAAKRR